MNSKQRTLFTLVAVTFAVPMVRAAEPSPPPGFRTLFNGRDLAGWHGYQPHTKEKFSGAEQEAELKRQREVFPEHWHVEDGTLVNDGHGPYACTDDEFADGELLIEYRTVAKADSGVYMRGVPQVQIWDWNQAYNPQKPTRRPHLGSGSLFNNSPGAEGRYPLVRADKPLGEWNHFKIRNVGERVWVWLNDQLVVDGAVYENYYDRSRPIPPRGPILLQTHGGEIRWRNIFFRDIAAAEATAMLAEAEAKTRAGLVKSLAFHASFDERLDADYARGDATCYAKQGAELKPAAPTAEVRLDANGGRFGGCLHVTQKNTLRPAYKGPGTLGYSPQGWDASVSAWLRLDPDQDLAPGYCDPVQIVGNNADKGFIFLEWSKDETPRFFRYAIRPLMRLWNPDNLAWDEIPAAKRPMVQIAQAPFSRERWTHVVFTLEGVNDAQRPQIGRLYIDGTLQGAIEGWDLSFDWEPQSVQLVLAAAYVGRMDDVAVFDKPLTDSDVRILHALPQGVRDLRP